MTTQDPDYAVTTPTAGLPTPDEVLAQTSWHDLEHARGSAGDLPAGLRRLLDDNILARTDAVATCLEVASHQSSTYTATTPVALYVAAILADPRASELEIISRDGKLPLLRVVLIDWLAAIAHDVSDEVLAIGRRNGFDEYPEQTTLRAARPVLFQAVMAFTRDTQPIVRQAAVAAALQILDTPEERHLHQQQLELNESPRSDSYRFPRSWAYEDPGSLPLRLVFRTVIAERFQTIPKTPQAAMLFTEPLRPCWDDRRFLGTFHDAILHQDTCDPHTAAGVPLLVALAVDDRVPPQQRFDAVELLFDIATASDRHEAQYWPHTPPHADPRSEAEASSAVQAHLPELLARWSSECPAVQLALAALAVVFPTERTLPALTARLQQFLDRHPAGTDAGDYTRFVLDLASGDGPKILGSIETLTNAYREGTPRQAPLRSRALHLLDQMLTNVRRRLKATVAADA